jgi:hypothetical protein
MQAENSLFFIPYQIPFHDQPGIFTVCLSGILTGAREVFTQKVLACCKNAGMAGVDDRGWVVSKGK